MRDAALALVVSPTGRVLAVSRPEPPHEMALPGGEVEDGESPAEAARRELEEETGMLSASATTVWIGRSPTDGRDVWVCRVRARGTSSAREPGTRVAWVTPGELCAGPVFGGFARRLFEAVRLR